MSSSVDVVQEVREGAVVWGAGGFERREFHVFLRGRHVVCPDANNNILVRSWGCLIDGRGILEAIFTCT